jgi:hypothetical protein
MATPPPLSRVNWPRRLARMNAELSTRIGEAYARHRAMLNAEAERVAASLLAAQTNITLTTGGVQSLAAFTRWRSAVEAELGEFSNAMRGITQQAIGDGAALGARAAADMVAAQLGNREGALMAAWNNPDPRAFAKLRDIVDAPAFRDAANRFGEAAGERAADVLLVGVSQGMNPREIGRLLRNFVGNVPLAWADTTARTAQLNAYRAASHESFRANADLVGGWVWWASLSTRTCTACISQHGTKHTNDEQLNDHHRGRCCALPVVRGTTWAEEVQTGPEWFAQQSAADQRKIMGRGRFDAYQSGKFDWSKTSTLHNDPIYGPMLRETTLKDLGLGKLGTGGNVPPSVTSSSVHRLFENGTTNTPIFKASLDAIDRVHSLGTYNGVRVNAALDDELYKQKLYGYYWGRATPELRIDPNGPFPKGTFVHETGHALDSLLFGRDGKRGTDLRADGPLWEVTLEMVRSQSYRNLQNVGQGFNSGVSADEFAHSRYLQQHNELWARAYTQYIAVKSNDPDLMRELAAIRSSGATIVRDSYWSDEDFEGIKNAMDALFSSTGMLK